MSRCDMAFIEPMHRNKPNITYLLTAYNVHPSISILRSGWCLYPMQWGWSYNVCQYNKLQLGSLVMQANIAQYHTILQIEMQ